MTVRPLATGERVRGLTMHIDGWVGTIVEPQTYVPDGMIAVLWDARKELGAPGVVWPGQVERLSLLETIADTAQ